MAHLLIADEYAERKNLVMIQTGSWRDPKSHLQEVSQRIDGETPIYRVLEESGPDHDKIFTLGVFVGNKKMGQGEGPSKQYAQQQAARAALKAYQAIDSSVKTV